MYYCSEINKTNTQNQQKTLEHYLDSQEVTKTYGHD